MKSYGSPCYRKGSRKSFRGGRQSWKLEGEAALCGGWEGEKGREETKKKEKSQCCKHTLGIKSRKRPFCNPQYIFKGYSYEEESYKYHSCLLVILSLCKISASFFIRNNCFSKSEADMLLKQLINHVQCFEALLTYLTEGTYPVTVLYFITLSIFVFLMPRHYARIIR